MAGASVVAALPRSLRAGSEPAVGVGHDSRESVPIAGFCCDCRAIASEFPIASSPCVPLPGLLDHRMCRPGNVRIVSVAELGTTTDSAPQLVLVTCCDCIPVVDLQTIRARRDLPRPHSVRFRVVDGAEPCDILCNHSINLLNPRCVAFERRPRVHEELTALAKLGT